MSFTSHIKKTKNGFTLPELIVVITILAILSATAFVSYTSSNTDARDASRKSDMGNLKVALRGVKQKKGAYPQVTGTSTVLTFSGATVATQGKVLSDLPLDGTNQTFEDPKTKSKYFYSSTQNGQEFQVGMILEWSSNAPTSFVDGEYRSVSPIFPSIMAAWSNANYDMSLAANQKLFLLNGNTKNLPYDLMGQIQQNATSLTEAIGTAWTGTTANYYNCRAIFDAGKSFGSGSYYVRDSAGILTQTGCLMNY